MSRFQDFIEKLPLRHTVNDIHSQLNSTKIGRIYKPKSEAEIGGILIQSARNSQSVSISSGRHSMGGQQFLRDGILLDTRGLNSVSLSPERGIATIGGGAFWPKIQSELKRLQNNDPFRWTFKQKQTGADRLSIGGSISSNIHGRGLTMKPFVDDLESIRLIGPSGEGQEVSRESDQQLWKNVVGGYGLFGVIAEAKLRLVRRHKVQRVVEVRTTGGLMDAFDQRIQDGYEFGDFQYAIDSQSEDFLERGVFSCYRPVSDQTTISDSQVAVPGRAWHHLVHLAHTDKAKAFHLYSDFYQKTNHQIYWSDDHQMTPYLDHYHGKFDRRTGAKVKGSEMITELYVPRIYFEEFMKECRTLLRKNNANVIYGTVRLIEPEYETHLNWANQNWACIIFNLHVDHDGPGLNLAKDQFRALIDCAQNFNGSFYLTYHPWATKAQLLKSYPKLPDFLEEQSKFDPNQIFASNWSKTIRRTLSI